VLKAFVLRFLGLAPHSNFLSI
jgi:bacteriorhodopsin